MRLLPLGTNGYIPSQGRQTMSFLVADDGGALVLDAGSGLARLLEPAAQRMLAGVERLDVVLTHYHLDHVVGLSYLPGVARDRPVRIFAPAPPLTHSGPEALARKGGDRLVEDYAEADRIDLPPHDVEGIGPRMVAGVDDAHLAARPR